VEDAAMAGLTRWSPLDELATIWPRDLWARPWSDGGMMMEWSPRCDVSETQAEVLIQAELPGVEQKDMEVTIREGVLYLKGEKRTAKKEDQKGRTHSERFFGSFERALTIPTNVDETKIEARLRDGVLEIHLPKITPSIPAAKKVEIKSA
jgi:HSP20 family protein